MHNNRNAYTCKTKIHAEYPQYYLRADNGNYPKFHNRRIGKEQRNSHQMLILQSNGDEFIIAVRESIAEYHNHNIERKDRHLSRHFG